MKLLIYVYLKDQLPVPDVQTVHLTDVMTVEVITYDHVPAEMKIKFDVSTTKNAL